MGRIFYLMGKSASGKDSIYKELLGQFPFEKIIMYTTRPMRQGEMDGVQYYFTDEAEYQKLCEAGKVIESRCYQTVHGPWIYYTVDNGLVKKEGSVNYLVIGTLESYEKMKAYYGEDLLVPLYIEVEDGERLMRALKREMQEENPRYSELCRRFLADEEDFAKDRLCEAGISRRFENRTMESCLKELKEFIESNWKAV